MNQEKYIGMDVHQATISVAVMDARGKLLMECLLETKAATILEFIQGLKGTLAVTFEEGTSAAWLHDLLKPHVSQLVVCDPRKNALLQAARPEGIGDLGVEPVQVGVLVECSHEPIPPFSHKTPRREARQLLAFVEVLVARRRVAVDGLNARVEGVDLLVRIPRTV